MFDPIRAPLQKIPISIKKYVDNNIACPVALIGCRATNPRISLDCCEYDLVIIREYTDVHKDKYLKIDDHNVELINISTNPRKNIIATKGMIFVKDLLAHQSFSYSIYATALTAFGKKSLVASLFCYDKTDTVLLKSPILASMWLKISAYHFLEGILALAGYRPMPLHELNQIRNLDFEEQSISDGIQVALTCIGIERSNRSTISRSSSAIFQLYSENYDKELVIEKAKHLVKLSMLPDCYYYLGKMASKFLANKDAVFFNSYSKLIQMSMDLSIDAPQIQKLQLQLFSAAKNVLKNYRRITAS
ncbi:MAG: hypothetical protein WAK17_26970 [Candidatus Nitrosopolaris sp.]|jgi:hypothetical protein